MDFALEIDVITFVDVVGVHFWAKVKLKHRNNCKHISNFDKIYKKISSSDVYT